MEQAFRVSGRLAYQIKVVQHEIRKKMDAALLTLGLTTPQYAVLSQVRECDRISNAELAKKSFLTPQTMNKIVQLLENEDLLTRRKHQSHGRILEISLTPAGTVKLARAHTLVAGIEEAVFAPLSRTEKESLKKVLSKLIG